MPRPNFPFCWVFLYCTLNTHEEAGRGTAMDRWVESSDTSERGQTRKWCWSYCCCGALLQASHDMRGWLEGVWRLCLQQQTAPCPQWVQSSRAILRLGCKSPGRVTRAPFDHSLQMMTSKSWLHNRQKGKSSNSEGTRLSAGWPCWK